MSVFYVSTILLFFFFSAVTLQYNLKLGSMIPPAVFLKIVLVIQSHLCSHRNLKFFGLVF